MLVSAPCSGDFRNTLAACRKGTCHHGIGSGSRNLHARKCTLRDMYSNQRTNRSVQPRIPPGRYAIPLPALETCIFLTTLKPEFIAYTSGLPRDQVSTNSALLSTWSARILTDLQLTSEALSAQHPGAGHSLSHLPQVADVVPAHM